MNEFHLSFFALCAVLLGILFVGLFSRSSALEYPTIAAMMGLAWVVPQGIEIELDIGGRYSSDAFWLYVTGCFISILLGFRYGYVVKMRRIASAPVRVFPSFNRKRLLIAAAGLTAIGQIAVFQMRGIDTSGMGGQWTGVITMWYLLAKANTFGLCLAVLIFARTRSRLALCIAIVAAIPILQAGFLGVRREALFDLAILTAGAWFISKNRRPPRSIVIACLVVGTVLLNSIGDIRNRVFSGEASLFGVVTSRELYRDFNYLDLDQDSASEIRIAQYDIWFMNQTWAWEYGADYWNMLVHQYVPAFLVGRNVKEGLKFDTFSERLRRGDVEGLFSLGSTRTGFSDTYRSFGAFGILVFVTIGYFFGVLYAVGSIGGITGQYFYLVLLAEGVKAITHGTSDFVAALPFTLILSLLALRFALIQNPAPRQHSVGRYTSRKVVR